MPTARRVALRRVIDGDTVIVKTRGGFLGIGAKELRIRLYGIDAPESDQQGGKASTKYLARIMSKRQLMLEVMDVDHYGRSVGLLYHRRQGRRDSYNKQMIAGGHAHWYSRYGGAELGFGEAQAHAQKHRLGLWKAKKHEKPWDYRRRQKQTAQPGRLQRIFRFLIAAGCAAVLLAAAGYAYWHFIR